MKSFGLTDKGKVRQDNQDSFIIESCTARDCLIVALCDGMGGAKAGGLASRIRLTPIAAKPQPRRCARHQNPNEMMTTAASPNQVMAYCR